MHSSHAGIHYKCLCIVPLSIDNIPTTQLSYWNTLQLSVHCAPVCVHNADSRISLCANFYVCRARLQSVHGCSALSIFPFFVPSLFSVGTAHHTPYPATIPERGSKAMCFQQNDPQISHMRIIIRETFHKGNSDYNCGAKIPE